MYIVLYRKYESNIVFTYKELTYSIVVFLYLITHAPEPKNHHYDPWNQLDTGSTS